MLFEGLVSDFCIRASEVRRGAFVYCDDAGSCSLSVLMRPRAAPWWARRLVSLITSVRNLFRAISGLDG